MDKPVRPLQVITPLLIGLSLVLSAHSWAQSIPAAPSDHDGVADDGEIITLEEFNVSSSSLKDQYIASESTSGTRMAERIVDLPYAVSSFTEEFIEDFLLEDEDLLAYLPGGTGDTGESGGEGSDGGEARVRGFKYKRIRDGFLHALPSGPSNSAGSEFLSGSASIFYGRTSPGGIMNYKTRRPSTKPAVGTTLSYGSNGNRRIGGYATGPLKAISPKLYYRIYADYKKDVGRYKVDKMETDRYYFGLQLLYRFRSDSSLNLSLEYQPQRGVEGGPSSPTYIPVTGKRYRGYRYTGSPDFNLWWAPNAYRDGDYYGAQLLFEHRLSRHWAMRAAVNYYLKEVQKLRYSGGTSFYENHATYGTSVFSARNPYSQDFEEVAAAFQSELVGQFRTAKISHRIMFGVDAALSEANDLAKTRNTNIVQGFNGMIISLDPSNQYYYGNPGSGYYDPIDTSILTAVSTDDTQKTSSIGAFTSYRASLLKARLIVLASIRYDYLKDKLINYRNVGYDGESYDPENPVPPGFDPENPPPPRPPVRGVLQRDRVSHSVGLNYKIAGDLLHFYTSYNTCFEPQNKVDRGTNSLIEPRIGKSFELGFKGSNNQGTFGYTLSLYDSTLTNIVVENDDWRDGTDNGSGKPEFLPEGKQRSRGVGLEASWKPMRGLFFRATVSYLDNEVLEQGPDTSSHVKGEPAVNTTPWAGSLTARYYFPSNSMFKGLSVALSGTWRDRVVYYYQSGSVNQIEAPSLFLLRGYITYKFKNGKGHRKLSHEIRLNFTNLLDKEYYTRKGRENFGRTATLTYRLRY